MSKRPYDRGFDAGYDSGYAEGFANGLNAGRVNGLDNGALFDGTSIVIPTYNQLQHVRECVRSIGLFTPQPHEIIVVDNGSADGTGDWLRGERRNLRFAAFDRNLGFAGAVNQGLRMARGSSIVILNNDTLVTANWLGNLLACIYSSPHVGLAGPVTNYISGEQLIPVSYETTEQMHAFAAEHNRADPGKWRTVTRITGFCLAMRRDVLDNLGYMDEGFEVGNCEDDDYGLRARLLGYDLVVAGDAFIHHVGSVSMRGLAGQFDEVYRRNLEFYSRKWGDAHALAAEAGAADRVIRPSRGLYPTRVAVRGVNGACYWIERGERQPIAYSEDAVRVSQLDLKRWPRGHPASDAAVSGEALVEGGCVADADGRCYQLEQGMLRRFISDYALAAWKLEGRVRELDPRQKAMLGTGLPIIAPPVVAANL